MDARTLRIHLDTAWKHGQSLLRKHGTIEPVTVFVRTGTTGKVAFLRPMGDFNNPTYKGIHAILMKETATAFKAELVIMLSEAWYAAVELATVEHYQDTGLAGAPGRQEVVILEWKTSDGEYGREVRLLKRDKKKPYIGGPYGNENSLKFQSRYFEQLFIKVH